MRKEAPMSAARSRFLTAAAAIGAAVALSACAAQQPYESADAGDRDCFNVQSVSGYTDVDRDTLRLSVGASRSYEVDLIGAGCSNIDWAERVAIEQTPGSWICAGDGPGLGEISFRDPTTQIVSSCQIRSVRRVVEPTAATP
jgi:hypothetical protein